MSKIGWLIYFINYIIEYYFNNLIFFMDIIETGNAWWASELWVKQISADLLKIGEDLFDRIKDLLNENGASHIIDLLWHIKTPAEATPFLNTANLKADVLDEINGNLRKIYAIVWK